MECKESRERSAIECEFGVGKRRYTMGCVMTHLKHTSEVSIYVTVLTMNLFKGLYLSFALLARQVCRGVQELFRLLFSLVLHPLIAVPGLSRLAQ